MSNTFNKTYDSEYEVHLIKATPYPYFLARPINIFYSKKIIGPDTNYIVDSVINTLHKTLGAANILNVPKSLSGAIKDA